MRIQITKAGIYGANGEIPVGTELTLKDEPKAWAGKYTVLGKTAGKTPVLNPAGNGYKVEEQSPGWFAVTKDGKAVTKNFRKDDLAEFDGMSDEDKAAFVDLHKAEA